jgi:Tfp pilus assembly protein PilX
MIEDQPMKETATRGMDERGSVMVLALIILVLLTLIGISATTTSELETRISRNERDFVQEFYVADSGWQEAIEWVNTRPAAPAQINPSLGGSGTTNYYNIRNYGGGPAGSFADQGTNGVLNENFVAGTEDGTLGQPPHTASYWFRVAHNVSDATDSNSSALVVAGSIVPGSGKNYREFDYRITSNVAGLRNIDVTVDKIFKVGY